MMSFTGKYQTEVLVSVGVDALLLATADQGGDKFLQNLCSHFTDLKNLLMVHLLLPTVVQRHLEHHTAVLTLSHHCTATTQKTVVSMVTVHNKDGDRYKLNRI